MFSDRLGRLSVTFGVIGAGVAFALQEVIASFADSADFPFLWDEIVVPVKYGSDHHLARKILLRAAEDIMGEYVPQAQQRWTQMVKKYLIEDARVQPMVTLATTDNWIEFTVRFVVSYKIRRGKKDELYTRILDDFLKRWKGRLCLHNGSFS